jgi:MFS superfamily sulfate permease-like transporter
VLSILLFFRRSWWPHGEVLGRVADGTWHGVGHRDDAVELPGVLVYRWEAPLFFANSGMFRQQVRSLASSKQSRWVVLQCEAVTDIDVTAAEMLEQTDAQLNEQGIHLAFVELRSRLQDLVQRYGLLDTVDIKHFYPTMEAALAEISPIGTDVVTDEEGPG